MGNVHYGKSKGRYNLASSDKDYCVSLYTPYGNVSETWPLDEEPDIYDLLPSEVLTLLEERNNSYWIKTDKEKTNAKIAEIRKYSKEIDILWLSSQLDQIREKEKRLRYRIEEIESERGE